MNFIQGFIDFEEFFYQVLEGFEMFILTNHLIGL
jgi:hypothetical protein